MKVASLVLLASLVACKPDPTPKPAEGSALSAAPFGHDHARGTAPALPPPGQEGSAEADEAPRRPSLDKDGDGVVSPEEREAARAERAKRMRDRFDANHDGKLTPDELAAAGSGQRGPRFNDPQALDTNNDGEISPEELQAGMRELRMQRRGQMMHGSE